MSAAGIQFHYLTKDFSFRNRKALKKFLVKMAQKQGAAIESLNFIFCSDDYLLDINRRHLQHDYYTDIITFQYHEPGQAVAGDVYISIDRVRENAHQYKASFQHELHRVIFHGLLHLLGYQDKTAAGQKQMRQKEEEYLNAYQRST